MRVVKSTIITLYIFGIVKNKASNLLPHFCFKVFDSVITLLTSLGLYYSCLPNVKLWVSLYSDHIFIEIFKNELLKMDNQSLELLVVANFIAITLFNVSLIISSPLKSNQYLFIDLCINCNLELLPLHTHSLNNNNNGSK